MAGPGHQVASVFDAFTVNRRCVYWTHDAFVQTRKIVWGPSLCEGQNNTSAASFTKQQDVASEAVAHHLWMSGAGVNLMAFWSFVALAYAVKMMTKKSWIWNVVNHKCNVCVFQKLGTMTWRTSIFDKMGSWRIIPPQAAPHGQRYWGQYFLLSSIFFLQPIKMASTVSWKAAFACLIY